MVKACYIPLFDMKLLITLDLAVCASLKEMGMSTHKPLFNEKKKAVNIISISTAYCVVSVLRNVIRALGTSKNLKLFTLYTNFSKLVALKFWWPQAYKHGIDACDYVP